MDQQSKSAISGWQAATLLFLSRIFSTMVYVPRSQGVEGATALVGALVAVAIELLLALPLWLLLRKMGNRDIVACAWELSPLLGKGTALLVWGMALLSCIIVICQLDIFLVSTVFPRHPEEMILLLFGLAILYGAWMGLEACARLGAGVFVAYLLVNLFVGLEMIPHYDLLTLRSPFLQGIGPIFRSALSFAAFQGETAAFFMLAPRVKGKITRPYVATILLTAAGVLAVSFMTVTALGAYGGTQIYPVYALFTMTSFLSLERMDSLYMTLWLLIAFLKSVLCLIVARDSLAYLVPEKKKWMIHLGNVLLSTMIGGVLLFQARDLELVHGLRLGAYPALAVMVLVPALLLGVRSLRHRKQQKEAEG